jgi:Protein of unknown function (DUF1573)
MKSQLFVLVAWLAFSTVLALSVSVESATDMLRFSKGLRIDLGDVPSGKTELRFDVANQGNSPVTFEKVSGSCTCMDIAFGAGQLAPGESRECSVSIQVQGGARQSSTLFFDVARPNKARIAILVLYHGTQKDTLDVRVESETFQLNPDETRELSVTCDWKAETALQEDDSISATILDGSGVTITGPFEIERLPARLRTRFQLVLDARHRDKVWAKLSFRAGNHANATALRSIHVPVQASLHIEKDSVLITDPESMSDRTKPIADCAFRCAPDWRIASVQAPDWLRAEASGGRIRVYADSLPPKRRATGNVVIQAVDSKGNTSTRHLHCVFDTGAL